MGLPSGGGWVWMPPGGGGAFLAMAKGKGKGKGGFGGKGKGEVDRTKEKLKKFEASKKVWVGGMAKKTTWKTLEKHFKEVADLKPAVVDVNEKKGTGVVCFKSEDDVATAVAVLNGSELDGNALEVDVWTKIEKPPKEEGDEEKKPKKKKPKKSMTMQVKKPLSKIAEKLKEVDASLKVWIGGLAEKTSTKELSKHFEDLFQKPDLVDLLPGKGKAVVTYASADDVTTAIAIVNGSELKGNTLELDVWTKPEKKEKVKTEKED